jgi:hypothetical protein
MDKGVILREGTLDQLLQNAGSLDDLFVSLTGRRLND